MRTIERTSIFRRDYKREKNGAHRNTIDDELMVIVEALLVDRPLEKRYQDYALTGSWADYRDCHIKPDLVLIYKKIGTDRLILTRLGSHSQLKL